MNNSLRKLHIGVIVFVVAAVLGSCHSDPRIKGFENFLLQRADSLAYAKCNEKEFLNYIRSYKNNPDGFDIWMEEWKENLKIAHSSLYEACSVIKDLDRKYGRELSYDEVVELAMSRPDTTANPDKVVRLQRELNALNAFTEDVVIWEEAQKWGINNHQL